MSLRASRMLYPKGGNEMKASIVNGFLHTDGRKMVNGNGERVILQGWGAGNWMNPEGYMFIGARVPMGDPNQFKSRDLVNPMRGDRGRTLDLAIRELCGSAYANKFWQGWYRNHLAEADIAEMARWGYNSIRLPLDAAALLYEEPGITFNEDSFAVLDNILDLCEKYGLYAILDMHGTPGHSGSVCDNGIDNVPRIFLEEETFERMVILWEKIARRYQDRWIVGAYELLNEPLFPVWADLQDKLAAFYDTVIERIRVFDKQHMFILSGAMVGTDLRIFDRAFDPECNNWAYTFHGYHQIPEQSSFQNELEASYRLNVPAWFGEGREAVQWMPVYYGMLAEQEVGYNLFCWKSEGRSGMENGPVYYDFPEGWDVIADYMTKGGPRPSYAEAQRLFDELLECIKFENCHVKEEMFRGSLSKQGITLGGAGYDSTAGSFSGSKPTINPLKFRLADGTKLVSADGLTVPPTMGVGMGVMRGPRLDPMKDLWLELSAGDFASYSVKDVVTNCTVVLNARAIGDTVLDVNGTEVKLPTGDQELAVLTLHPAEAHTVRFTVKEGTVQIKSVAFK